VACSLVDLAGMVTARGTLEAVRMVFDAIVMSPMPFQLLSTTKINELCRFEKVKWVNSPLSRVLNSIVPLRRRAEPSLGIVGRNGTQFSKARARSVSCTWGAS
jgi:hypothetical protein